MGGVEAAEFLATLASDVRHSPDTPLGPGLVVILRQIRGLTEKGLLPTPFVFQAAPLEEFTRQSSYSHSEYETLRAGQHSRPAGRALEQTSFGTIFVDYNAPWDVIPDLFDDEWRSVFPVPDPVAATKKLRSVMMSGTPILLTVHNPALRNAYDLRMASTMRSLTVTERSGEVDARYVDVSFVEYRDIRIKRFLKGETGGDDKLPVTLSVKLLPAKRDTFAELAKHYYGDPSLWRHIRHANSQFKGIGGHHSLKNTPAYKKNKKVKVKVPRKPAQSKPTDLGGAMPRTAEDADFPFGGDDGEPITGVIE